MRRKILLLITDLEIGGTPTVVREVATRLNNPAGGVEVEVACLAKWGPVADQIRDAGVTVTAFGTRGPVDFFRARKQLIRLCREAECDTVFSFLIHANAIAAAASSALPGVRFIQSIQTTQPNPRWHWWLQSLIHGRAEHVVVPSPSAAEVARDWSGVPAEKLRVIPNAVDVEQFQDLNPPVDEQPLPVGFIGRLDPIKRLPDLIRAVGLLRGRVRLHIFGEGAERPELERLIRHLQLGEIVTLHGAVPRPQDALRHIGLLVLPSKAEGFGLVLIEAMAAGVPVLATNVPGIRDVVRDRETGILVPCDPSALAAALERLVENAPLRRELAAAGYQDVCQRFTWSVVLPQYAGLLIPRELRSVAVHPREDARRNAEP
jgi:glycosyltransferase involved in cell wall biosynthesis